MRTYDDQRIRESQLVRILLDLCLPRHGEISVLDFGDSSEQICICKVVVTKTRWEFLQVKRTPAKTLPLRKGPEWH